MKNETKSADEIWEFCDEEHQRVDATIDEFPEDSQFNQGMRFAFRQVQHYINGKCTRSKPNKRNV